MARELSAWLTAFFFTQAVEVPIYVAALHRGGGARPARSLFGLYVIAFGASALTHPVVWFVIPRLGFGSYVGMVAFAEAFAVVAEGVYLWGLGAASLSRGLGLSLLANGMSVGLGFTSRALFGVP